MIKDERFYAFIVAHTSRSRIHRISVHPRWLKASACVALIVCGVALYGIYSFTRQVAHLRLARENIILRIENEKQRQQLANLKVRVEAVEDESRRLAEISGVSHQDDATNKHGAGGPSLAIDAATISAIEYRAAHVEKELQAYQNVMRERAKIPSVWPVEGEMTDGFGTRRNPFDEASSEFHAGQDIAAPWGTPVTAAGSGVVAFAGTQSGYGQIVIIDHGNGLTTRYGHLSVIEVQAGQEVGRGTVLGRVGSTGRSTGPHLHYEVRINESAVSPRRYLPIRKADAVMPTIMR